MEFDQSTVPQETDKEGFSLRRINRLLQNVLIGGMVGVTTQPTIGTAVGVLVAAGTVGKKTAIYNNSATAGIWITLGGVVPIADTGTLIAPNGNGKGIFLGPGDYWETPSETKTAIFGISNAAGTKVTVITFSR